ncbi:hypothetical protein V8F20_002908 [Naviculisporaceae sp. PSN 640]
MSVSSRIQLSRWGKKVTESEESTVRSVGSIAGNSGCNSVGVGPFIWDHLLDEDDAKGSSPSVDIVFVHGLRGHYLNTWSATDEHGSHVFWPGDLLREDIEEARVISWGYDAMAASAQPGSAVSQNSIFGHAGTLLNDLADRRIDVPKRPIIWIGHSLGGLVIKEAIIRAASSTTHGRDPRLGNLYTSTIGVIFMGTPHRGSPKASLGESAARFTSRLLAAGSNMQVLGNLRPDSHALEKQLHDFVTVSSHIPVVCFYEELKTGRAGMIVPRTSAVYDGKMVSFNSIPADHRDMVRFRSRTDIGYRRVLGHIQSIWASCKEDFCRAEEERAEKERCEKEKKVNEDRARAENTRQMVLQSLTFPGMDEREDNIEEGHSATLDWIFAKQPKLSDEGSSLDNYVMSFQEWLRKDGEPAFWVSGKAGSGKSTFMKRICRHEKTAQHLRIWAQKKPLFMCNFFLYELGTKLGKCRDGMLRSILHQILSSDHGRQLLEAGYPSNSHELKFLVHPIRSWNTLRDVFHRLLSCMKKLDWRLCLFIDGLDEYRNVEKLRNNEYTDADLEMVYEGEDGDAVWGSNVSIMDDHREVLNFFRSLWIQYPHNIKLCLSSRELMIFEDGFAKVPRLRMQDCNKGDITRFSADQLEHLDVPHKEKESLVQKIATKSCGVFLWVRLVIKKILDGYASGDSISQLHETIDEAPSRLCGPNGLFMKMLQPIVSQRDYRLESSRIFGMMMLRAPSRSGESENFGEDLWYALENHRKDGPRFALALDTPVNLESYPDSQSTDDLRREARRRIKGRTAGLVECEPPFYKARFMHYSVYQFLSNQAMWDRLFLPDPHFRRELAFLSSRLTQTKLHGRAKAERFLDYDGSDNYHSHVLTLRDLVYNALSQALYYDRRSDEIELDYIRLIDELDHTMTILYQNVSISQSNHVWVPHDLPHNPAIQYDNFLLNAAEWGLSKYMRFKIERLGDQEVAKKTAQKLLGDLIYMRSHFLTVLRKPDIVKGMLNNHPWGSCYILSDSWSYQTLLQLGATPTLVWDNFLSLGFASFFARPPRDKCVVFSCDTVRFDFTDTWFHGLGRMLDYGGDPFQPAQIKCDHWTYEKPLPPGKVTLMDILELMASFSKSQPMDALYPNRTNRHYELTQEFLEKIRKLKPGEKRAHGERYFQLEEFVCG